MKKIIHWHLSIIAFMCPSDSIFKKIWCHLTVKMCDIHVEIKCQLDATDGFFIADLVACSTCFGHHYAHHQKLKIILRVVAACGIWCFGFQVVGLVWSWGLCVQFAGCCRVFYGWLLPVVFGALGFKLLVWCRAVGCVSTQTSKHQIPQAATTCIILLSSWWWA